MDYQDVVKRLEAHGDLRVFINRQRGKGSHRIVAAYDSEGNLVASYPLPYHGNKTKIRLGMLQDLIRKFNLPRDFFK